MPSEPRRVQQSQQGALDNVYYERQCHSLKSHCCHLARPSTDAHRPHFLSLSHSRGRCQTQRKTIGLQENGSIRQASIYRQKLRPEEAKQSDVHCPSVPVPNTENLLWIGGYSPTVGFGQRATLSGECERPPASPATRVLSGQKMGVLQGGLSGK